MSSENRQPHVGAGRYAPSPTGDLHLGNLRTALLAWAAARNTGRAFYLRLEDLDRARARDPQPQVDDLAALGIDWDGEVVVQSQRLDRYQEALDSLRDAGLVFECFCSRRDIREASSAAHTPPGAYPGTCIDLSEGERQRRRVALAKAGRAPALRLRPRVEQWTVHDTNYGEFTGPVENVVLQRGDGEFAYNLAVVVDDVAMGVDQIVRGDDLLSSAPLHSYLARELGGAAPTFGHVPLILGPTGQRLAKRDGAVTLRELRSQGTTVPEVVEMLGKSVNLGRVRTAAGFRQALRETPLPTSPWTYVPT